MWLNSAYAKHIVKGNFMTLSARPKTVEQGEWIAHQGAFFPLLSQHCYHRTRLCKERNGLHKVLVVEHYRNLWNFVRVVHEKEDDGISICNSATCPKMSAGQ